MENEQLSTAYLVIQQGTQAGRRVEIWKDITTIGRSRQCDLFLEDIAVHRRQASIIYTDTGYKLRDDHGSGDSLVNGKSAGKHGEQLLQDGDQLLFGHTSLIFYTHEATRPFQQPSSRGRELLTARNKKSEPLFSASARLDFSGISGSEPIQSIELHELQPEVTIGRSRECTIFLEDLAVSRLHATIRQLPDESYEVEDHRSATGTFVNGQAITRYRLLNGDIVQIGSTRLTFHNARG